MLFTTEDSEFSWWQFPWTSVHYGVVLFVSQLIKFFLSLYNVTDRKERVGVQRNSLGFKFFFFVIQVQCNIHWFASGSLLTREDDSWDTSCGRYAGTGRKPKTTSSHQSVNRRFERQWSGFEVGDLVIISTCGSLCSICRTNVWLRSSFHRDYLLPVV